jgi:hypothetical protein
MTAPVVAGPDLDDARESLAYWEDRAQHLPVHAIRRRREAVDMAERWRSRVEAAERDQYGRGLFGAVLLLAAEGRLPVRARHTGHLVAHRARQAALFLVALVATALIIGAVVVVEVVAAVIHALG